MKAFYGSRFSPNQTMTPEGFLVAHNVPISRAGWYEYLGNEIGADTDAIVKVYRDPDEVFSPSAMASFEGKPVADGHPPGGAAVMPDSASRYVKGAVQNVRQGSGENSDLLLADLVVYDEGLIKDIQAGKREVSSGYECEYAPNDDGTYSQRSIVGNHVAVVENGRAGDRVRIQDSKSKEDSRMTKKLQLPLRQSRMTDFLAALGLKHFATDADPEKIMDAVDAMAEERSATDAQIGNDFPVPTTQESKTVDGDPAQAPSALEAKVDKLTELVTNLIQAQAAKEQSPEDAIDAAIAQMEGPENTQAHGEGGHSEEESHTIDPNMVVDEEGPVEPAEDRPKNPLTGDNAYKIAALRAIKPIMAAMSDPVDRKKVADAAIASVMGSPSKNTYAQIQTANRKKVSDKQPGASRQSQDMSSLGLDIAKKYNQHYKEKV